MVAEDGDGAGVHDALNARGRLRPVANDVAKAKHPSHRVLIGIRENSTQGIDVAVDIAENGKEGRLGIGHSVMHSGGNYKECKWGADEWVRLREEISKAEMLG